MDRPAKAKRPQKTFGTTPNRHKFQEIVKQINLYGNHFTSTFLGGQQPAYPGYSAAVAAVHPRPAARGRHKDNLKRCVRQGKYVGIITDVYKGTYFIRLNIGVNAVAHSCNMASLPSKRDEVGFVVTRINDKFEVAEGIITRMIKRGA